jgi:hypothetical protein
MEINNHIDTQLEGTVNTGREKPSLHCSEDEIEHSHYVDWKSLFFVIVHLLDIKFMTSINLVTVLRVTYALS